MVRRPRPIAHGATTRSMRGASDSDAAPVLCRRRRRRRPVRAPVFAPVKSSTSGRARRREGAAVSTTASATWRPSSCSAARAARGARPVGGVAPTGRRRGAREHHVTSRCRRHRRRRDVGGRRGRLRRPSGEASGDSTGRGRSVPPLGDARSRRRRRRRPDGDRVRRAPRDGGASASATGARLHCVLRVGARPARVRNAGEAFRRRRRTRATCRGPATRFGARPRVGGSFDVPAPFATAGSARARRPARPAGGGVPRPLRAKAGGTSSSRMWRRCTRSAAARALPTADRTPGAVVQESSTPLRRARRAVSDRIVGAHQRHCRSGATACALVGFLDAARAWPLCRGGPDGRLRFRPARVAGRCSWRSDLRRRRRRAQRRDAARRRRRASADGSRVAVPRRPRAHRTNRHAPARLAPRLEALVDDAACASTRAARRSA